MTIPSGNLALVTFLVRDYDEAIAFFTGALRFALSEDTPMPDGKRWVVVTPPGPAGTGLLLAQASTPEQAARIGDQAGGRVAFFLHVSDFDETYDHMKTKRVRFTEEPRSEPFGKVVVFLDLYGNKWDLIQPIS